MSRQIKKTHKLSSAPQYVRILAGCWRGTKLPVILKDDVRPTPNRVRETLFNWLQPYIIGSKFLDLFAGSGALGFEAVSRGANSAILIDHDKNICDSLNQQTTKLQTDRINVMCHDALSYVEQTSHKFDVIFLDPPFSKYNPIDILQNISVKQCLKPGGLVYVEFATRQGQYDIPSGWHWKRHSKAGEVQYGLLAIQ